MSKWNLIPDCEWVENDPIQQKEVGDYLASNPTGYVSFDTETTGIHKARDYPLMFSLSDGVRRFGGMWEQINHPALREQVLENPQVGTIFTNAKFDMHMAANKGVHIKGPLRCTLVMDWLYDENRWNHDLKATAKDHIGIKMKDFKQVFPMKPKRKNKPPDTAGDAIRRKISTPEGFAEAKEYAGLDAYATFKVHDYLVERLQHDWIREPSTNEPQGFTYWDYFQAWEMDFTRVLYNMERRGFCMAPGHLKGQLGPLNAEVDRLMGELAKRVGHPINPNSTQQLQRLFFDELGYQPIKWTKGGKSGVKKPSTDSEVLTEFAEQGCPISQLIMDIRSEVKIRGTYIEGPLELIDENLRLHTNLKQHGTVTGRLSSSDPNLQNIPATYKDKYVIRDAFVASPGKVLLVSDYEQLEMRIMAHFSQDPRMVKAIYDGLDLHCYTVSMMYGVEYDEVYAAKKVKNKEDLTDRQHTLLGFRQAAKATGFGLIYGIGPMKLGRDLSHELGREIDIKEAQGMIRGYFNVFRGVEAFIKKTHADCKKNEFVRVITGRKRRLPQINAAGGSGDDDDVNAKGIAAQAKRQSVNSIIQGTAAEIAKAAMIRSEFDKELNQLGAELLLQIHDELIFELPDDPQIIDLTQKRVQTIMEKPFGEDWQLSVPLPTSYDVAYTWAEAK